jgi:excisionase family DNA binding protein
MTTQIVEEAHRRGSASPPDGADSRAAYTVVEVALLLGLSRGSTYALVRSGKIPALRMGGRWIVPRRRFHAWLDQQPPTGGAP